MMMLSIGDRYLDTDDKTRIGLKYEGGIFGMPEGGGRRSYDLSVPDTRINRGIFELSDIAETEGLRVSAPARLQYQGAVMDGDLYLKRWASDCFELLFCTGKDGKFDLPVGRYFRPADSYTVGKGDELSTGTIPNFGFYTYENHYSNGAYGILQDPPTLFPSTNLGYLIDGAAAALGLTVVYDNAGTAYYNAYNYGIKLPTMNVYAYGTFTVTGTAANGYQPSAATRQNYHLHYVTKRFKRGRPWENKTAYVFEALAPVHVCIENVDTNYVVAGNGKEILAEPYDCFEKDMETGDFFAIVAAADKALANWGWYWSRQTGYETAIDPVTMKLSVSSGTPTENDVLYLRDNLPDMSLSELLDAYCLLTCSAWSVSGGTVTVTSFSRQLQNASLYASLDGMRVLSVGSIQRYIDGYARHNIVRCADGEYITEGLRFERDYDQRNDYLSDTSEFGTVPFHDGNYAEDCDTRIAIFTDVFPQSDYTPAYAGQVGIFFANLNSVCDGSALHISVIDSEGGVGDAMTEFFAEAVSVNIAVLCPLRWFAGLQPVSVVRWRGRSYIVKEASWGDGAAELELVRLPE